MQGYSLKDATGADGGLDTPHQLATSVDIGDLQFDEISSTQPGSCGTADVHVNSPSSQYHSYSAALSPSAFPSPPYSSAPFSYSNKQPQFSCDAAPLPFPSNTLPPPSYLASVGGGVLSPGVVVVNEAEGVDPGLIPDSVSTASSLINGDPTTRHYAQQQPPQQHHLHGVRSLSPPPLVSAAACQSHQQPSAGLPPPLIAKAEPHSPACNSGSFPPPPPPPCSYSDYGSVSPAAAVSQVVAPPWWPVPQPGNSVSGGSGTEMVGHSPWSAPPVPVARQTLYFAGSPGGHSPLSPISPSCIPPPLSAPPSSLSHNPGTLHHHDTLTIPSWPRNMVRGPAAEFFEAIPQQQRRLRRVACTCLNCASGANSKKATNPDGSPRKKQHVCHYPNCSKVYGKTSHLRAHIRWHTGNGRSSATGSTAGRGSLAPTNSRDISGRTPARRGSCASNAASGSCAATTSTSTSRLTRSCGRRRPAVAAGARRAYQTTRTTNQSLLPRMRTPPVQSFSKVKISSKVSSNYHLSQAPISYGIQLPSPHPVNNYVAILCICS